MISCKRATELISKRMEEPLTVGEELSLKLHLFICEFCEKFKQQAEMIRSALGRGITELPGEAKPPEGAKERLKKLLDGKS